ncbi:MAG: ABC transporter ATP-binding protein/permease [Lachnospiraceae bacterium]|jgi:ATP-binding cassette subfamily B protein|nr:ABC transporter ATP-binding protein/permease [Lachnospiraceae bacterium]
MSKSPEKKKGVIYVLLRLWKYLVPVWPLLLVCVIMLICSNLLDLAVPFLSGKIIDAIGENIGAVDFKEVFRLLGFMAGCVIVSSAMSYLLSLGLIRLGQEVSYALRKDIFERLSKLPVSFFDRHPVGDIISRVCYDVDTINTTFSTDLMQVCASFITVAGSLCMLIFLSPLLSVIIVAALTVSIPFTNWQIRRIHPLFKKRSAKLGEQNGVAEESITAMNTVAAFRVEEPVIARYEEKNIEAIEAYNEAEAKSRIMGPTVNFINNMALSAGSILGAILCINGKMSLGGVSSFVLYSRKYAGPIREIANIISDLQTSVAAAQRVFSLMDELPEAPDCDEALGYPDGIYGEVKAEGVTFAYEPGTDILKDFNMDVPAGSVAAIVGTTGAGKTTIVNLLMRFYEAEKGKISIRDTDIRHVFKNDLRRSFAMVLQDAWLFSGSIYDNIAYGNHNATMEDVVAAAKAAHIHRFILSLPDGYQTQIGDDSSNISKGQKQLITIARAWLTETHMLILDEATSNVDTDTEREITIAMRKLMQGKTCFVIAHRLSTIQNADIIMVLDKGKIAEKGTHSELMRAKGLYYNLYAAQFRN